MNNNNNTHRYMSGSPRYGIANGTVRVVDTGPGTDDSHVQVDAVVTTFNDAEELYEATRKALRQMAEVRRFKNQEVRLNPRSYGLFYGDLVRIGHGRIVWEFAGLQPSWKNPGDVEAILHTRDDEGTINRTRRCAPTDLIKEPVSAALTPDEIREFTDTIDTV